MVFAPGDAEKSFLEHCKEARKNLSMASESGEGKVGKTEREKVFNRLFELQIISDKLHHAIRKEYKADGNYVSYLVFFGCFSCVALLSVIKYDYITPATANTGLFALAMLTVYAHKTVGKFKQKERARYEELSKRTIDEVNAYIEQYEE